MEIALSVHHRVVLHSVRVTRSARVTAIAAMITMRSARKVKLILFAILTNIWLLLNTPTAIHHAYAHQLQLRLPFLLMDMHEMACYLCMYNIIALREYY